MKKSNGAIIIGRKSMVNRKLKLLTVCSPMRYFVWKLRSFTISTATAILLSGILRLIKMLQHLFWQSLRIKRRRLVSAISNAYSFLCRRNFCGSSQNLDTQNIPIILPAFDAGGVLFAPLFFECYEVFQGLIFGNGGVDLFQIGHQRLEVLVAHKAGGGADLMDDAPLHLA